jgi:hypothetical protein
MTLEKHSCPAGLLRRIVRSGLCYGCLRLSYDTQPRSQATGLITPHAGIVNDAS